MDEHVSWKMLESWVSSYSRGEVCASEKVGELIIEVDSGMIGLKNPKKGLLQIINPNDFETGPLHPKAKLIACSAGDGDYFAYILNPGSKKVVLLELVLEKEAFGVYSQDYPLGFALSESYCASAIGKNFLLLDFPAGAYVFINEEGVRRSAQVELGAGAKPGHTLPISCTVVDKDAAAICTPKTLFVIRREQRVGINLAEALGRECRHPEFGYGKSESHSWLAIKDGESAILVSLTDKSLGYTVIRGNELKGKEIL
ncbi:hypothetical protein JW721_02575 [Candidatus Micrarchaeota archaeon]|nr:hypothetical protein [Candidatus Micrarchaeota archaeon]